MSCSCSPRICAPALNVAQPHANPGRSASVGFGKIESMKFSSYMQHCLKELQENREYETDVILAHMVRLQNLSEKIAELNARDESSEEISIPRAPVSAYVSTFQSELDKIQSSISKTMKNNSTSALIRRIHHKP